jgi:phosphoglycolate phosphatase
VGATEVAQLRDQGNREIVRYLGVPAWKTPFIAARMRKQAAQAASRLKLFKDVPSLLWELKARGVTLAVVSSNSEAVVRRVLGPQLAGLIDHYACSASIFGKAAKFRSVMRRAGVRRSETLCVGDEVRDIEAARKAGLPAAAVAWGYATREILAAQKPEHLFERPADILTAAA